MSEYAKKEGARQIEQRVKNENKQKVVLDIVSGIGILTLATLTPGALTGIAMFKRMFKRPRDAESTYRALQRLGGKGYLKFSTKNGRTNIEMTNKGRIHLARLGGSTLETRQRWDGNWRMVIYDISEKRKKQRKLLQEALRNTGFYRLQDSIWVYPYACDDLVVLLRTEYQLGREVLYMVAKHMENDKKLREYFGLTEK